MQVFVCLSEYLVSLEELSAHLADHVTWISGHTAAGRVLAAGRQSPPVGGVILMRGESKAEIEAVLATDPYALRSLGRYTVVEFSPRPAPVSQDGFLALLEE
jgi:uncharacterized protein YciI